MANNRVEEIMSLTEMRAREKVLERAVLEAVDLAVKGWKFVPIDIRNQVNIWDRLLDLRAVADRRRLGHNQIVRETIDV